MCISYTVGTYLVVMAAMHISGGIIWAKVPAVFIAILEARNLNISYKYNRNYYRYINCCHIDYKNGLNNISYN